MNASNVYQSKIFGKSERLYNDNIYGTLKINLNRKSNRTQYLSHTFTKIKYG